MAFMNIGIYVMYLFLLVPIPAKNQSWEELSPSHRAVAAQRAFSA